MNFRMVMEEPGLRPLGTPPSRAFMVQQACLNAAQVEFPALAARYGIVSAVQALQRFPNTMLAGVKYEFRKIASHYGVAP